MRHLTNEEQQQLLKYLPSVDVAKLPDRLASSSFTGRWSSFMHHTIVKLVILYCFYWINELQFMAQCPWWFSRRICSLKSLFDSPQFRENLTSFQQLLAEGVFDISLSGVKPEDCKTLKKLALSSLSKSKWVEQYHLLKVWVHLNLISCYTKYCVEVIPEIIATRLIFGAEF